MSAGSEAYTANDKAWAAERKRRQRAAERQKAAREALAYDDAPRGLTREALIAQHQQMKADCLRRMSERNAA